MANTIIAGNATNNGLAFSSDNTGVLNILTGTGSGTTALSIDASQNVSAAANLTVTGSITATNGVSGAIRSGTAQTAPFTSPNTYADFTSIPSGVKRITVMFNGISTTGTSALQVQIGGSGSVENTGYVSNAGLITGGYPGAAGVDATATSGFVLEYQAQAAADTVSGHLVLTNVSGNIWVGSGLLGTTVSGSGRDIFLFTGTKTTSTTLNTLRVTTVLGSPTFDAGSINILYE